MSGRVLLVLLILTVMGALFFFFPEGPVPILGLILGMVVLMMLTERWIKPRNLGGT